MDAHNRGVEARTGALEFLQIRSTPGPPVCINVKSRIRIRIKVMWIRKGKKSWGDGRQEGRFRFLKHYFCAYFFIQITKDSTVVINYCITVAQSGQEPFQ